jgi:DNA adenine methylase
VEPFAGGLAVLLAKPRSPVEVLNDKNGDLVCFYRCVRFHCDPLLTELEFVLNSRQEFYDFKDQPGLTDIQRAARWFFRNKTCFGGSDSGSFGVSAVSGGAGMGSRHSRLEAIRQLSVRLDRVCIEHLDWADVISRYDRAETFFFLDPPYTACDAGAYAAWTTADVLMLRDRLAGLRGRWLVTLNDHPDVRRIFSDCRLTSVERARGINNRPGSTRGKRYRELVIEPPH